ncbi:hypothetical protein THAOC_24199 [Thalassiosira oceanica]|uniref:Uncharacterized protein n=1 Tax=Thalassiosira oceanica TaxID=159749 RepID=K0RU98_THAOC|nr:hypothetical protein THAOC_24199 [Thalassiosira oceanica]|eukprot:EJK55994.1 hypothetical protein THAOC_24199 [Thalassiosira oceanica]
MVRRTRAANDAGRTRNGTSGRGFEGRGVSGPRPKARIPDEPPPHIVAEAVTGSSPGEEGAQVLARTRSPPDRSRGREPANERPVVSAAPSEPPRPRIVPGGRRGPRAGGGASDRTPHGCPTNSRPFAKRIERKDLGAGSVEIDVIAETGADKDCTALELGAAASRLS